MQGISSAMKKTLKKLITAIGDVFGFEIQIHNKHARNSDYVLIDRFVFSPFLIPSVDYKLYAEAISRADGGWSDNFYKQCRYYSLVQIAAKAAVCFKACDIAECGVWKGHSAYMISKIFFDSGFAGTFHIFDSFQGGLSEKVEKDRNLVRSLSEEEIRIEKEVFSSDEDQVNEVLSPFSFVRLYAGWIPARFIEVSERQFCFIHIDVDLYEPTLSSLEFFWPRLVTGGFVVVDDYGLTQFPGAALAVDEFISRNTPAFFYKVPMGACFIIK